MPKDLNWDWSLLVLDTRQTQGYIFSCNSMDKVGCEFWSMVTVLNNWVLHQNKNASTFKLGPTRWGRPTENTCLKVFKQAKYIEGREKEVVEQGYWEKVDCLSTYGKYVAEPRLLSVSTLTLIPRDLRNSPFHNFLWKLQNLGSSAKSTPPQKLIKIKCYLPSGNQQPLLLGGEGARLHGGMKGNR